MNRVSFLVVFLCSLFLFFSSGVKAEEVDFFSVECGIALEEVKNDIDISAYSSVYTSCFKEIYVDTTSTKIGYFIFGDIYMESLKFFTLPFKLFVYSSESIINSSELFSETEINAFIVNTNSIIDQVKGEYNQMDSIVLSGSISSLVISLTFIINSIVTGILIYILFKLVWNFQKGKIEASKDFSTSIIRLISGIGLMSPFIYGYSMIQFILLGVIAFGSSIATMLFVLVYLSFLNMEVDILTQRHNQSNADSYIQAAENIQDVYHGQIISNLCTIRKTEEIISSNIGDSKLVKYNNDHKELNFINCLSGKIDPDLNNRSILSGNNVMANRNLNYCLLNHSYFYNFDSEEKVSMTVPNSVNCGEYSENNDPLINDVIVSTKSRAEDIAIKYHENECRLNYNVEQIGSNINFKCIKLNSIGDFSYNDNGNPDYFRSEQDVNSRDILADKDQIFKTDNFDFHEIIKNANMLLMEKVRDDLKDDGYLADDFDRVKMEQLKSLERVIRNGWLHGFSIFMPKNFASNISAITSNDYFSEYQDRAYSQTLHNFGFDDSTPLLTENDSNLLALYNDVKNLRYYTGVQISDSEGNSRAGDFFGSIMKSFTGYFDKDSDSAMERTEKNMNDCIINRDNDTCNFGGDDIMGLTNFVVNPIDSFYHTVNDLGHIAIGGFLGFSVFSKISDNPIFDVGFIIFAILFLVYLLATIFMVFTPFFIFISMVLGWLYKLIKSPFYIQLFVLWYILPQSEGKEDTIDSDNEQESRMYKVLGEMMLMPLFIIIGVISSFAILVISYVIISVLSFIVFSMLMPSSGGLLVQLIYFFSSYTLFLVLTTLVVFQSAKQMGTAIDMLSGYFGFEKLETNNQFEQIERQLKSRLAANLG